MSKLVRAAALSVAVLVGTAAVVSVSPAPAPAQAKKPEGKKPAAAEVKGAVEIYQDAREQYRFRIKGGDGKTLAQCVKGYDKKEDCEKALDALKEILKGVKTVEVKGEKDK